MKTNQIMETIDRSLCSRIVRQRTKDEFLNELRKEIGIEPYIKGAKNKQLQDRDLIHSYITDLTRTLKDAKLGAKLGIQMYIDRLKEVKND